MLCFEVEVRTTNSAKNAFRVGDTYHACEHGKVFVFAKNFAEVGRQIPEATVVRVVGVAFMADQ